MLGNDLHLQPDDSMMEPDPGWQPSSV